MNPRFLRLIAFLILLPFSFHQISFAYPIEVFSTQSAFEQYLIHDHNKDAQFVSVTNNSTGSLRDALT